MNKKNKSDTVFTVSAVITIVIALWGIISNDSFAGSANNLMQALQNNFSWLYLGVMLFFVLFSLGIAFSKFGNIRLGSDDEKPEYNSPPARIPMKSEL